MRDQALIDQYLSVLNAPAPPGRQKEQVVQDFLEMHTELIPTPNRLNHGLHFYSVISKFPLGTGLITDYAYLTKSSDTWRITFVELESPDKTFFNKKTDAASKTAIFNAALDQVRSWKRFISSNEAEVRQRLKPLLKPLNMLRNPVEYQYQLIYGRSADKNLTEDRKAEFQLLQRDHGITIMTFDQLVSYYNNDLVFKKNVLRLSGMGYSFKSMEAGPNGMLAYLDPGELSLSEAASQKLKSEGYDMDSWVRGNLLEVNGRYPRSATDSVLSTALGRSGGST